MYATDNVGTRVLVNVTHSELQPKTHRLLATHETRVHLFEHDVLEILPRHLRGESPLLQELDEAPRFRVRRDELPDRGQATDANRGVEAAAAVCVNERRRVWQLLLELIVVVLFSLVEILLF
jgi:hypothetical protein